MVNYLKMDKKEAVCALLRLGWPYRRIERETGVRRETVARYHKDLRAQESSNAATLPTGKIENRPGRPPASASLCGDHDKLIRDKIELGLDARRIHQDLVFEHGFTGGYDSVKRFCRGLRRGEPEVFSRVETAPGCQVQVDFARGAPTRYPNSERYRRPWLFEAVLSFSRHRYCEVVWRQDLATWIRCFENAFEYFGGAVEVVRIDNLKAGIRQACFYDPEVNPVFAAFGRHYGFAVLPTRPGTPREKALDSYCTS
jgi:transposase